MSREERREGIAREKLQNWGELLKLSPNGELEKHRKPSLDLSRIWSDWFTRMVGNTKNISLENDFPSILGSSFIPNPHNHVTGTYFYLYSQRTSTSMFLFKKLPSPSSLTWVNEWYYHTLYHTKFLFDPISLFIHPLPELKGSQRNF